VSFCITIWKREHAYKFTRWCDPRGENTNRTLYLVCSDIVLILMQDSCTVCMERTIC